MNISLRSIGLFGILLFSILFSITYLSPETIENSARGFVKYQIEKEINEKQLIVSESTVASKALSIAQRLGVESEQIQENLANDLPEKIASVIAHMCNLDCERKKMLTQSITSGYLDRIKSIDIAQGNLSDLIKGKYIEIVGNLKLDLRIFFGSNLLMFLILLAVSFSKPKAMAHLFLPGVLLLTATMISTVIYIFGQDWFYTILYNDYMGFGYLAFIAFIFAVLVDIVLNKARVTTEILNAIGNLIGSSLSLSPC